MLQQQTEQTVLLHVCRWATGPLHPKVAGQCWELLHWSICGLVAYECFNALIPDTVFFAYNLRVVWMLTLLALNPPSWPSPLACFHFGLPLPTQCGVHIIYVWPLTNDTAQFLSVLCFILVSNVVHVTYYLLNQFVFIICVVAREHEEQFLSLIF